MMQMQWLLELTQHSSLKLGRSMHQEERSELLQQHVAET